jgi:arylsulfatase A-like enzyme
MRRFARPIALLLLLGASGCRRPSPSDARVTFDPELVDREPGTFEQSFDGPPSKIVLGTGWYGLESLEKSGPWSGFAWASASATVYFGMPLSNDLEVAARLAPFAYPGSPPQSITPVINGNALPSVALHADWQEVRVSLPPGLLRAPVNVLELRFAHAAKPSEAISSTDPRELSAVFDDLAVLPRGRPLKASGSEVRAGSELRREVTLRGPGLAVPLPAGSRDRIRFGVVRPSPAGLRVSVDLWSGGAAPREVWSGPASRLSGRAIDLPLEGLGPSMLLLRLGASGDPAADESASVALELFAPGVFPRRVRGDQRPDIFLYLIDTLRADALGVYGSRSLLTPRMDEFARDAVTYERASSTSSWTLPATVSILSGMYPFEHGMSDIGDQLPKAGLPWLPEELSRLGYETAAFSQWPFGRSEGLERGFDRYYLDVRMFSKSRSERLRGLFWQHLFSRPLSGRPLFSYVHVSDPHSLYDPQGKDRELAERQPGTLLPQFYDPQVFLAQGFGRNPADRAHLRALYDGEVRYTDRQFGAFLDLLRYLGLYEQSLIILVADHGEEFYEHGGFDHGRTLYEELLRVPLIVKFPGARGAGTRVSARVSTLDLVPSVLELVGRHFGDLRLQGRPLAQSPNAGARELIAETRIGASETMGHVDLLAVVAGNVKCILNKLEKDRFRRPARTLEAYDLAVDPGEQSPLEDADPRVGPCRAHVKTWLARASEASQREGRTERPLPPEEVRRLRALGYLR